MTYYDLMVSANRKLDNGDITLGEYEEMIEPLKREIEPERKPGHWEWDQRTGEYVCSECGCNPVYEGITPDVSEIDKYRFCRWCGSKMEVEDAEKPEM